MPAFPQRLFPSTDRLQFGMLLSLASIGMFFAAFAAAFVLIIAKNPAAIHITLPGTMWLSTVIILASSLTLERSRYVIRRGRVGAYRRLLTATLVLGTIFLAFQGVSWERLASQGIYMGETARGSAFYAFSAFHAFHLAGGLIGLAYVLRRAAAVDEQIEQTLRKQRRITRVAALYWHSMGVLWVFLFALLLLWAY